jgi:hypothetical protein
LLHDWHASNRDLQISRIRLSDRTSRMPLDGFDVLLATATKPTPDPTTRDFPTVVDIATAWNARGDASYFHSNRKNGFYTFQDEEIAALLHA